MGRVFALAAILALAFARGATACPMCAGDESKAKDTTSVWWAVGAFLLVPPVLGTFVLGAMRRELKGGDGDDAVPAGVARFKDRSVEP
jgi:hypothetical protein